MVFLQNQEPFWCPKNAGSPTMRTWQHRITKAASFFKGFNYQEMLAKVFWFIKQYGKSVKDVRLKNSKKKKKFYFVLHIR